MVRIKQSSTWSPKLAVWLSPNLSLIALAAVASGCQAGPSTAYSPPYPAYDYGSVSPAAGPTPAGAPPQSQQSAAPVAAAPAYSPVPYQALEASSLELKERLERVEKAMLRLDRRMQLVERNELSRMGPQTSQADNISGNEEQVAMRALNIGSTPQDSSVMPQSLAQGSGSDGYRPVASRDETITSALQAAPSLSSQANANYSSSYPDAGTQVASRNSLPSLADPAPAASRSLQPGSTDIAIWTVKYEPSKVWPERDQLPSSREVVEALRRSGGGSVTLYARGKNANAVEFRERVKALSRYLSKVSSLDSVPIAAMASPNLDDETIEILATH